MHTFTIAISIEEVLVEEVVGITGTRFTQAREKQVSHDQLETSVLHCGGWGGSLGDAVQSLALLQDIRFYVTIRNNVTQYAHLVNEFCWYYTFIV